MHTSAHLTRFFRNATLLAARVPNTWSALFTGLPSRAWPFRD